MDWIKNKVDLAFVNLKDELKEILVIMSVVKEYMKYLFCLKHGLCLH